MPKVKCADCDWYEFYEDLGFEPKGGCNCEDQIPGVYAVCDYNGKNWRYNHRWSQTLRYCKFFKPRKIVSSEERDKNGKTNYKARIKNGN